MGCELAAEAHLLDVLAHLGRHVTEEEERARGGDGQQVGEVGFHGTSTAELVGELGVNRESMYAEFGSKQGLFDAALDVGQQAGEISATADLDDLAAFLTMALVGIATLAKGRANPDQIHAATTIALSVLDLHQRAEIS